MISINNYFKRIQNYREKKENITEDSSIVFTQTIYLMKNLKENFLKILGKHITYLEFLIFIFNRTIQITNKHKRFYFLYRYHFHFYVPNSNK